MKKNAKFQSGRKNPLIKALGILIQWLDSAQIEYMIFGGIANSVYGNPRQTFDIDLKVILEPPRTTQWLIKNVQAIAAILPDRPRDFLDQTHVLPVQIAGVGVDIVQAILPFEIEAIRRSVQIQYAGLEFRLCTVEDLIIHKVVSERPKDWDDVRTIIRQQAHRLDRRYLLQHCRDLSQLLARPEILNTIARWLDET